MRSSFSVTFKLLALFFVPVILGGGLVFFGLNRNIIFLIVVPVILILLASFLIELVKNAKDSFFQYDQMFEEMGFRKRRLFLILKSYEKELFGSTLRVFYGPGRASYASRFSLTAKIKCPYDLAIGQERPLNTANLPEVANAFSSGSNNLKAYSSNPDWAKSFLSQDSVIEAVNKVFANRGQHDSFSLVNDWLWSRILFQQVDRSTVQNLIKGIEALIGSLALPPKLN